MYSITRVKVVILTNIIACFMCKVCMWKSFIWIFCPYKTHFRILCINHPLNLGKSFLLQLFYHYFFISGACIAQVSFKYIFIYWKSRGFHKPTAQTRKHWNTWPHFGRRITWPFCNWLQMTRWERTLTLPVPFHGRKRRIRL